MIQYSTSFSPFSEISFSNCIPSRHHGLDFILGEITLGSCRQFVSIQRLQFVETTVGRTALSPWDL